MWKSNDVIAWRGIFRKRIWHAMPVFVVRDTQQELVLAIIPGTVCKVDKDYGKGKKGGKRIWDFMEVDWKLSDFIWHGNRVLFVIEPEKYYSINLFWSHEANSFNGYYVNFQHPYRRHHCGIDAMDLELDLDIKPDLTYRWKDTEDYHKAIECGIIPKEFVRGVESAKPEVIERVEKQLYPFDGSWLSWRPNPRWEPPKLPENWDKI